MIVDACAWTGAWGTHPLPGTVDEVAAATAAAGTDVVLLSPLGGVWAHNPHLTNPVVYAAAAAHARLRAAPVLDVTLPTWEEELARAVDRGVHLVRWLPAYAGLDLGEVPERPGNDLEKAVAAAETIGAAGLALWVQTRLEDPRRQHRRAVVPDVPAAAVVALARRCPHTPMVLGGTAFAAVQSQAKAIGELPNLYVDVSQVDGVDSLLRLVDEGLAARLLHGSHAPFFTPLAGLARVVVDLDDAEARAILGGNAERLLGL